MVRICFLLFIAFFGAFGCHEPKVDTAVLAEVPLVAPQADSAAYSFQLFVVTDSLGAAHGMGYDIYNGTKRMIHQTSIPGVQGNNGFATREDAEVIAKLVVKKLDANQGFPTISIEELDSLHINLQH